MSDREKTCKECIHNEMCYATHTDDSPCCCDFKDKSKWKEQKRGEWINARILVGGFHEIWGVDCSECGWTEKGREPNYCPNCGAYMKGENK